MVQIVFDILQSYTESPQLFEQDDFKTLLDVAVKIGVSQYENPRMFRALTYALEKQGKPTQMAIEEIDEKVQFYIVNRYKSPIIDEGVTSDLLRNSYIVKDDKWLIQEPFIDEKDETEGTMNPDERKPRLNLWFNACYNGDLAYIKQFYDIYNR